MIDLHTHILPGVDDGAATIEDSVAMARAAVGEGIAVIAATPHVRDDFQTDPDTMERLLGEVRSAVDAAGLSVDIRPGGELALTWLERLSDDDLQRFSLAGSGRYVLLEFPYYGWPLGLPFQTYSLQGRGLIPVLAHPERNADVQTAPERLRDLVDTGVLVQVTAASLDGRLGMRTQRAARRLLELELVHLLASDAHSPDVRGIGLRAAAKAARDDGLARWLIEDVPGAILAGEPIPGRPARRARRRWFRKTDVRS